MNLKYIFLLLFLFIQGKEPKKIKNLIMLLLSQQKLSVAIEHDEVIFLYFFCHPVFNMLLVI